MDPLSPLVEALSALLAADFWYEIGLLEMLLLIATAIMFWFVVHRVHQYVTKVARGGCLLRLATTLAWFFATLLVPSTMLLLGLVVAAGGDSAGSLTSELATDLDDTWRRNALGESERDRWARECDDGELELCLRLATALRTSPGADRDLDRAEELCRRVVATGDPAALACLGGVGRALHEAGEGERGAAILEETCLRDRAIDCTQAGYWYSNGVGVAADLARAVPLARRGCDGGRAVACRNLGLMYQKGRGVAVDAAEAARLFERACELGNAAGCVSFGFVLRDGEGIAADPTRAASLFAAACGSDEPKAVACSALGRMKELGEGVPGDLVGAVALYRKACAGGAKIACRNASILLRKGLGVEADAAAAKKMLERACELGHDKACAELAGG